MAHNAKFELQWLFRAGVKLETILCFDSLLCDYIISSNRRYPLDLNSVASRRGLACKNPLVENLIHNGVCPSCIPQHLLLNYCAQDVILTEQVFLRQREELRAAGQLPLLYTKCLFTPLLAEMELNGIHLDNTRVTEVYDSYFKELAEVENELYNITNGINIGSSQQVARFIYSDLGFEELKDKRGTPIRNKPSKAFPDGTPKTDEPTLSQLRPTTRRQKEFLALRLRRSHLSKAITTYLERFVEALRSSQGVLHGKFNQAVVQTGRLSGNLQQIPRDFKKLFSARREGWLMGEGDFPQLEFRAAVFLGDDDAGRESVANGEDVHAFTASVIGVSRQDAKEHTFKPLYGGQSGTPSEKRYYKAFKEKYSGVAETQEKWKLEVLKSKELVLPTGHRFYWPDTAMDSRGYVKNTTNICNYPVQYFATAEIAPIASFMLWHHMKAYKMLSFIVNCIHDSTITELNPEERELYKKLIVQAYTEDVYWYLKKVYNIDFDVALGCDIKIGPFWGEPEKKNG